MYVYALMEDEFGGEWQTLSDNSDDDKKAISEAAQLSLYSYSEPHVKDCPPDYAKVRMEGDLTLDIDSKDLAEAIVFANRFLDYLENKHSVNPDHLKLYCSGSKGFHIVIDKKLYDDAPKPLVYLNQIHSWMVAVMGAESGVNFDMSLYYQRHLIRTGQKRRKDGKYKVPVTAEEVRSLTPEKYLEYVSAPRKLPISHIVPAKHHPLNSLWAEARARLREAGTRSKSAAVPDEQLALFSDRPPLCIEWQVEGVKLHRDSQFNKMSMNLASFIAHAGNLAEKVKDTLIDRFAKNAPSDSRNEAGKRRHLETAIRHAQSGAQQFGCGFNRAQLEASPCNGCPIKEAREAESQQLTQIEIGEDGYYAVNSKGDGMKLTTFTLERKNEIIEYVQGRKTLVGEVFEVKVFLGKTIETQLLDIGTEEWTIGSFKKVVSKVSGAIVKTTSDAHLANIREFINNSQPREGLMRNELVGIQVTHGEDGEEDRVWLEPGWSTNSKGISSAYHYTGAVKDTVMSLRGVRPAGITDTEAVEVLRALMHSNKPESVSQMLGWAAACHLKSHLNHVGSNEFPLLHISGQQGSGKTHSSQLYSAVTGAFYHDAPTTIEIATNYPLKSMLSETTTVARIFDEFNKGQLEKGKYNTVYGYLKALYCRQMTSTGYAGKANNMQKVSAASVDKPASAPMIYMARAETENEELRARSIIIRIKKQDQWINNHNRNFDKAYLSFREKVEGGNAMQRIVKLLVTKALRLDTSVVSSWKSAAAVRIDTSLPPIRDSRRIVNIQTVLVGLRFLRHALDGFDVSLQHRVDVLEDAAIAEWKRIEEEDSATASANTTSEIVIRMMDEMSGLPADSYYDAMRLKPSYHFIVQGKTLWLNPRMIRLPYQEYARRVGAIVEIPTAKALLDLMKETNYFLKEGAPSGVTAKDWICIDLSILENMGVLNETSFDQG